MRGNEAWDNGAVHCQSAACCHCFVPLCLALSQDQSMHSCCHRARPPLPASPFCHKPRCLFEVGSPNSTTSLLDRSCSPGSGTTLTTLITHTIHVPAYALRLLVDLPRNWVKSIMRRFPNFLWEFPGNFLTWFGGGSRRVLRGCVRWQTWVIV